MSKSWIAFLLGSITVFVIDQGIKSIFLSGWEWESDCFSLHLVYNKGVAFSMLAFLGPWLKWLQLGLLAIIFGYLLYERYLFRFAWPIGILFGAGLSNITDRFRHGGVVDYVDWHCGFDFAVFNFADVMIDLSVLGLLILGGILKQKQNNCHL